MVSKPQGLQVRLVSHASAIVNVTSKLPKTYQANHVSKQLVRSGTAAAANYGEARGAESKPDFIHKLRIVLKELNETSVWLDLIIENAMLPADKMRPVVAENDELCRIVAASIRTAGGFDRS
jgi:four helix bundle protein